MAGGDMTVSRIQQPRKKGRGNRHFLKDVLGTSILANAPLALQIFNHRLGGGGGEHPKILTDKVGKRVM